MEANGSSISEAIQLKNKDFFIIGFVGCEISKSFIRNLEFIICHEDTKAERQFYNFVVSKGKNSQITM